MSEAGSSAEPREPNCLWCGHEMVSEGEREFRTGGTTGGWKLAFGEWAELGEGMMKLEILVCPACRRVDLRAAPPA